jgi:hypothetical protein
VRLGEYRRQTLVDEARAVVIWNDDRDAPIHGRDRNMPPGRRGSS